MKEGVAAAQNGEQLVLFRPEKNQYYNINSSALRLPISVSDHKVNWNLRKTLRCLWCCQTKGLQWSVDQTNCQCRTTWLNIKWIKKRKTQTKNKPLKPNQNHQPPYWNNRERRIQRYWGFCFVLHLQTQGKCLCVAASKTIVYKLWRHYLCLWTCTIPAYPDS